MSPTKLTINSGTGIVSLGGSLGENKELASLNITSSSTQVNGSSLNTSGNQTYSSGLTVNNSSTTNDLTFEASGITVNGAITAYGEDITISANISSTLSGADVSFYAKNNINTATGTLSVQSSGGDILLNSNTDGNGGAINLDRATVESNGGNIKVSGRFRWKWVCPRY